MALKTGVIITFFLVIASAVGQDYCSICRDHTMCLYQGVGSKCSPRINGGVSRTDQATILNTYNEFRQKVAQGRESKGSPGPQPAASNMRKMTWSKELAKVAQRWADQCDFTTDKCRKVAQFPSVGQGIYKSSTTGTASSPQWKVTITNWYDHVKDFNKASISPYVWGNAGLYSQIVWADTYQVGCGYTVYQEPGDRTWTHQMYVCNYGPAGNMAGDTMYKKGPACSKCPESTSCRDRQFPALCS